MATITDTLETVLTLKGVENFLSDLGGIAKGLDETATLTKALTVEEQILAVTSAQLAAAKSALLAPLVAEVATLQQNVAVLFENVAGFGALAAAEGVATAATATLQAALAVLLSPLVLAAVGFAAFAATVGVAVKSAEAFGKSQLDVVRVATQMKALGNVFPTKDLLQFADAMSQATGIDDELIATLAATAVQFGLTQKQVRGLIPAVLDIAQIKGKDPTEVLTALLRASRGRTQGLIAIGIDPSKIKGDIKDIDNLIRQVGGGFKGGAANVLQTLPGALNHLKTELTNLLEAIGASFGGWVNVINNMAVAVHSLATGVTALAKFFEDHPILGGGTRFEKVGGAPGSALALKGDPEQTRLLGQIADNTKQADRLAREVLGGPGTVAAGAVNWRDYQMSMGV